MAGHSDSRGCSDAGARHGWRRIVLSATILLAVTTGVVATPGIAQAATGVSNLAVGISPPTSAAGGLTTYAVTFTTSSSGALDGNDGSSVTIALPANTGLGSFNYGYYYYSSLDVGATQVGYCEVTDTSSATPTVTCYLYSGETVGASTAVTATLYGVTNPPAGSPTLDVSTSSDVTPVTSPAYTVTAAQSVSGVGVTVNPTSAAGGLTTYGVTFTTSSTGALDGTTGSTVTIALPANTGLGSFNYGSASSLDVGSTQVGYCDATDTSASTPTVTCYLYGGDTAGASTAVTATLAGVTNPPVGSPTLDVSTTSDVTPVTSPAYTVTAAQPVSAVGVTVSPPTSAAGGLTTYGVTFTTSSTGALDGTAGSTVTIALPANTGLGSFNYGYYYYSSLDVGAAQVGYCEATDTSASTPTVTCYVYAGDTVGASTAVTATLTGVTNPPIGLPTLDVSTSSDVTPVTSPAYTVTAAQSVSGVGVTISPPTSAAGGLTTYGVTFTTSSTGALDGNDGSTVTIALPPNTGLGSFNYGYYYYSSLDVGASQVGYCEATDTSSATPTVTCYLYSNDTVGASTTVTATLAGVTNPPVGSPTLDVSTSSDVTPVTSPPYTVTAAQPVSAVGVTVSPPTSAAGGLTTYGVTFTTSSTGALDGTTGSTVTIALPANSGLSSFNNGGTSSLDVGDTQIGYCDATDTSASTPTVTCYLYGGDTVAASTAVTATLYGVTNPPAGSPTLDVSTSSDVTPVTSPPYTVTAAQPVSGVGVTVSPPTSAAGGLTTYGVTFTTSSTGALDGTTEAPSTIALPANTDLGSFNNGGTSSLDVGDTQVGYCDATDTSASTPTVTCYVYGGDTVGASTAVTATLYGVTNPPIGLAHPGRIDQLGRYPGDLTRLHGDRRPIGESAGCLLVQPVRTEHVHLPGHLQDLVHRGIGRHHGKHCHHRPAGQHRPQLLQQRKHQFARCRGHPGRLLRRHRHQQCDSDRHLLRLRRGHGRCLDGGDGHARRRDQPRCRLRHIVGHDDLGPDTVNFGELRPRGPGGGHLLVHRSWFHHDQLPGSGIGIHRPSNQHRRGRDLPDHAGIPHHHSCVSHQSFPGSRRYLAHRQFADDQRKWPHLGGSRKRGGKPEH